MKMEGGGNFLCLLEFHLENRKVSKLNNEKSDQVESTGGDQKDNSVDHSVSCFFFINDLPDANPT